jgi:hypothetical protein
MSCPNSDPQFDKTMANFYDINAINYPEKRKQTYYFVCIIFRFILYASLYKFIDKPYVLEIITGFALLSLLLLYPKINEPNQQQWWSRKFQFIIALLISVIGSLILFGENINRKIVPILLLISLFGGIFQSMLIDFC